jgi:hypothetical protein
LVCAGTDEFFMVVGQSTGYRTVGELTSEYRAIPVFFLIVGGLWLAQNQPWQADEPNNYAPTPAAVEMEIHGTRGWNNGISDCERGLPFNPGSLMSRIRQYGDPAGHIVHIAYRNGYEDAWHRLGCSEP